LPGGQLQLIDAITQTGTPTIVVLIHGRPATFGAEQQVTVASVALLSFSERHSEWNHDLVGRMATWYGHQLPVLIVTGEEGGTALSDILFGSVSPTGKLASTWYRASITN
jgi:hypothetical protein